MQQPVAFGLQVSLPQKLTCAAQANPKQFPEQQSLLWLQALPFSAHEPPVPGWQGPSPHGLPSPVQTALTQSPEQQSPLREQASLLAVQVFGLPPPAPPEFPDESFWRLCLRRRWLRRLR